MDLFDQINEAAAYIRGVMGARAPKAGLVLGSGLNALADELQQAVSIPYGEIPHFPKPGVSGHSGRLVIGDLNGVTIACLQGRVHGYEGHEAERLGFAVRTVGAIGVGTVILTNAAGSLDPDMGPGSLMIIDDHINLSGLNPLIGRNDDRMGPRFPDMTVAWDKGLRDLADAAAQEAGLTNVHHGVYLMVRGPNFETPAEIRAFRILGASAVGMSTVPECLAARHAGLKVMGISSVTNLGAGMTGNALTHDETISEGAKAAVSLSTLLKTLVTKLP